MSASLMRKLRQAQDRLRNDDAPAAQALCEQILREAPRNPDALFLLGMVQLSLGRAQAAVEPLKRALAADPGNGAALENLGLAYLMLGQFADAESTLTNATRAPGAPASVFMRLGVAILEQGRPTEALTSLRTAVAMRPQDADNHLNLGRALADAGEIVAAREHFHSALALAPQCADAAFNLGVLAVRQGELELARGHYRTALSIAPDFTAVHERLGAIGLDLGDMAEAVTHLKAAVDADRDNVDALSALARALYETGQLEEAESAARHVLEIDPGDAAAYATLANRHLVSGEIDLAIRLLEAGYAKTNALGLLAVLTYQLRHVCDWEKWQTAWSEMARAIEQGAALGSPFWLLCEPTTAQQQLAYTRRWAAERFKGTHAISGEKVCVDHSRLRIGYLSSDLHEHATAYLIAEILELHDRDRFEVYAYSYGPEDGSSMRQRLRSACEHFVDIARAADEAAAQRIKDDALDVLVDLKGYTLGDRLTIMARRPCDVQVTWLGYPGTTGAAFIDYLIADPFVIPTGAESNYSERIVRLPHCYQPNDRKRTVADVPSRLDHGLPERAFVFCCFNQSYKITPEVFGVWMRLLRTITDSVLWLLESNAWAKENLLRCANAQGVDSQRLVFAARLPNARHLARYHLADLALDTFPYTSHTTLSDALWCGCPMVALCGDTFAARVSGSLLSAAGMADLITYTLSDYEHLAMQLALDPQLLAGLRARTEQARSDAPLFDSLALTRDLEALYVSLARRDPESAQ